MKLLHNFEPFIGVFTGTLFTALGILATIELIFLGLREGGIREQ